MNNPGSEEETVRQLNLYLAKTGKRQYELAADIGVPAPTVNRWLTGKSKVSKAYQVILKTKGIIR